MLILDNSLIQVPVNHRTNFDNAFPGVRVNMQVHHASPKAITNKYPNLMVSANQMHSVENLRGISNDQLEPGGSGKKLHQHITNRWQTFYDQIPNILDIDQIFDFAKIIDDDYGHLFIPPIR